MQDPFFAGLMFRIERLVCAADRDAVEKGIVLKDSQVQSALNKAKGLAGGRTPKLAKNTEVDRLLAELATGIGLGPEGLAEEHVGDEGPKVQRPPSKSEWVQAIDAVIDSIKLRRSGIPASRDYLNFVHDFVAEAEKSR